VTTGPPGVPLHGHQAGPLQDGQPMSATRAWASGQPGTRLFSPQWTCWWHASRPRWPRTPNTEGHCYRQSERGNRRDDGHNPERPVQRWFFGTPKKRLGVTGRRRYFGRC
jgi:hypothetical protein